MLDSLKEMLKPSNDSSRELQNNIKKEKERVEKELKYSEHDKVNIDFLLTMLGNGFIDEDYRYFISKRYGGKLDLFDNFYLNILKCDLSPDYKEKISHLDRVVDEIHDYQWSHPSVLNNNILTYLFENNMSEQIDGFINAIQNHFVENEKDDFVKQYDDSLPEQSKWIVDNLLGRISEKNSFAPFFNKNSESLFCRMLCNLSIDKARERKIPLKIFLKKRKNFAEFIFETAKKNDSLKNKLQKLDIEVESIVNYKDSVRTFIVDESLYKITKKNLDYVFASFGDRKPYSYFDYIRENVFLRKKIIDSSEINDFVKNILLGEKKITISSEGIVVLLFNNYLESEMANRIIERIDDESVDLVNLRLLRKNEIDILKDFSEGQNIAYNLIRYKKVKVDFSNTLYLFEFADEKDFLQFLNENIDTITKRMEKDEYVWSDCLSKFYKMIYSADAVGTEIFTKISDALISEKVDILDLVELDVNVPIEKEKKMLLECFKRSDYGKIEKTGNIFFDIIKENFDFFIELFSDIKWLCFRSWEENMSVFLKIGLGGRNKHISFEDNQINILMQMISPYSFSNIMKYWKGKIGTDDVSEILEKIFIKKEDNKVEVANCFDVWIKGFGKTAVAEFLNNNNASLNNFIYKKLKDYCSEWVNPVVSIASKSEIIKEAVADGSYVAHNQYCQNLIDGLKTYVWDKQNDVIYSIRNGIGSFVASIDSRFDLLFNDLFVLGRNIYQAADGAAHSAEDLVRHLNEDYLCPRNEINVNPVLLGAVFEAYFDHEGNLRRNLKMSFYQDVMKQLNDYPSGITFIRNCLFPYFDEGLLLYIPGQDDVAFDVSGSNQGGIFEIQSIKCFGIEILISRGESNHYESGKEFIGRGNIDSLKRLIGNYLAIPMSHIKLNMPNSDISKYRIDEYIKDRCEVALAVDYNRRQKNTIRQELDSLMKL